MDRVKAALHSEFGIKDLCEAECFEHSDSEKASGELFISQRAYLLNVLARFKHTWMQGGFHFHESRSSIPVL